jgi:hypothetical protein
MYDSYLGFDHMASFVLRTGIFCEKPGQGDSVQGYETLKKTAELTDRIDLRFGKMHGEMPPISFSLMLCRLCTCLEIFFYGEGVAKRTVTVVAWQLLASVELCVLLKIS